MIFSQVEHCACAQVQSAECFSPALCCMTKAGNPQWDDVYIGTKSTSWGSMLDTWLTHTSLPVHVVQYERLLSNSTLELSPLLQFLGQPVNETTLDCISSLSDRGL